MKNHASDIEAAPSIDNLADIDFRVVMQCGSFRPADVVPSQGATCSHATLVRGAVQDSTAQVVRRGDSLSSVPSTRGAAAHSVVCAEAVTGSNAASLQALLRLRHVRAMLFTEKIFVQPAWDMLLELLESTLCRRRISVSGLYLAAGVPPATALRRLQDMEDAGLIARVSDPNDRRRQFVELTPRTLCLFQAFAQHGDARQALRMDDCSR